MVMVVMTHWHGSARARAAKKKLIASHTPGNKNLAVDAEINAVTCVWRFHIWERGS